MNLKIKYKPVLIRKSRRMTERRNSMNYTNIRRLGKAKKKRTSVGEIIAENFPTL